MRISVDSVILVYFLDHVGVFQSRDANRITAIYSAGDTIVISDVVRMECRMQPIRLAGQVRLARIDGFFARADVEKIEMTSTVFDRATEIRARHQYKPLDSLNLAAAVEGGCDRFLTNDLRLRNFPDLTVEILP